MKKLLITTSMLLLFAAANKVSAQSVAINSSGAIADTSALLDLTSTAKGILVPRMTATQRGNIYQPATGLMVYQTDGTAGFYYNSGTAGAPVWNLLQTSLANITTQGNTFNAASKLVQLDASAKLPAVDGSALTNLNGSNIASGTVADARLTTNVTVQGNTFNAANKLVQLNGSGKLPALDGSLLTGVTATPTAGGYVVNLNGAGTGTYTLSDLTVRSFIVNYQGNTGGTVTVTIPSAASYPAGTIIRFSYVNYALPAPTFTLTSSSTIYNLLSTNSGTTAPLFGNNSTIMTDGTNWYKL